MTMMCAVDPRASKVMCASKVMYILYASKVMYSTVRTKLYKTSNNNTDVNLEFICGYVLYV